MKIKQLFLMIGLVLVMPGIVCGAAAVEEQGEPDLTTIALVKLFNSRKVDPAAGENDDFFSVWESLPQQEAQFVNAPHELFKFIVDVTRKHGVAMHESLFKHDTHLIARVNGMRLLQAGALGSLSFNEEYVGVVSRLRDTGMQREDLLMDQVDNDSFSQKHRMVTQYEKVDKERFFKHSIYEVRTVMPIAHFQTFLDAVKSHPGALED